MKVYLTTGKRDHLMIVQPGNEPDGKTSDFLESDGRVKTFKVKFVDGRADVPSYLGRYLIDKGVAQRTSLIEPAMARCLLAQETRVRTHRTYAFPLTGAEAP